MSLRDHTAPPFPRGQTLNAFLYGTEVTFISGGTNASQTTEHPGEDYVAREHWFPDVDYGSRGSPNRTGGMTFCRCVRNNTSGSGFNLLPKRLVQLGNVLGTAGPKEKGRAYGYATTDFARAFPVDEYIISTGFAQNDMAWVVIRGPATIVTDMAQFTAITVGGLVAAVTAAGSTSSGTSGNSTGIGGRIGQITWSGTNTTGTVIGQNILALLGYAMSACTSQGYNVNVLVDVGSW